MPENKERINEVENIENTQKFEERRNQTDEIIDLKEKVTIPRGVKAWMEKVEEDPTLSQNNQKIKGNDDSILQPIATTVTKINLPIDKKTFTGGFIKPVDEVWRWMSEFVLRIIKKNQGNVKFKEE